jgi:hypothetical protein
MIAMRMMQASAHQVIDVIPVRQGFVAAGRAMLVRAARLRRALHGVGGIDRDGVLVDMVLVRVMQMAIVEIIDMALVSDRRVPTVGAMLVAMIGMMLLGAGRHSVFPSSFCGLSGIRGYCLSARCVALSTKRENVSVGKRMVDVLCLTSPFDEPHMSQRPEASRESRVLPVRP